MGNSQLRLEHHLHRVAFSIVQQGDALGALLFPPLKAQYIGGATKGVGHLKAVEGDAGRKAKLLAAALYSQHILQADLI